MVPNFTFKRVILSTPSFKQTIKEHTTKDYSIKEGIVNKKKNLFFCQNGQNFEKSKKEDQPTGILMSKNNTVIVLLD